MKLHNPLVLPRLMLRNLLPSEAQGEYKNWVKDPSVNWALEFRYTPPNEEEISQFIDQMNKCADNLFLGIFLPQDKHIGNVKLGPISWRHSRANLGILVGDTNHWRRGYATEVICAVSDYAFQFLGLHRLVASCYASNIGSIKAFQKAGFKEEGRLVEYWQTDYGWEDEVYLGKLSEDVEV